MLKDVELSWLIKSFVVRIKLGVSDSHKVQYSKRESDLRPEDKFGATFQIFETHSRSHSFTL